MLKPGKNLESGWGIFMNIKSFQKGNTGERAEVATCMVSVCFNLLLEDLKGTQHYCQSLGFLTGVSVVEKESVTKLQVSGQMETNYFK